MTPELRSALFDALMGVDTVDELARVDAIAPIIDAALQDARSTGYEWELRRGGHLALLAAADDLTDRQTAYALDLPDPGDALIIAGWLRARANEGNPA